MGCPAMKNIIVVPGRGHCDLGEEFQPMYEKAAEDPMLSRQ